MKKENEIVKVEQENVIQLLSKPDGLESLINDVRSLVDEFEHDMSTKKGRDKTASLAYKVSRFKTRIDELGKDLVSEWKQKAKAVDKNRKSFRDAMDELKAKARKPLSDWEAEEEARIEAEKLAIQKEKDHDEAIDLNRTFDLEKAEAERIEREKKEKEERERKEREARIAQEAREAAIKEAERKVKAEAQAAALREAQKKAEIERLKREKIEAETRHRLAAEEAKKRQEKAVKAAQEQARIDAQNARIAEEKAAKAREDDKKHKAKINNGILSAMLDIGISEKLAKELIKRIAKKEIPNISINY